MVDLALRPLGETGHIYTKSTTRRPAPHHDHMWASNAFDARDGIGGARPVMTLVLVRMVRRLHAGHGNTMEHALTPVPPMYVIGQNTNRVSIFYLNGMGFTHWLTIPHAREACGHRYDPKQTLVRNIESWHHYLYATRVLGSA